MPAPKALIGKVGGNSSSGHIACINHLAEWIKSIPFSEWPQQTRIDSHLRPAMVTDLAWHGFGAVSEPIVRPFKSGWRALSCVMPGHSIERHIDEGDWLYRVHVPLLTNERATFNGEHMAAGFAYEVNPREPHEIRNDGATPRIHLIFDVIA